MRLLNKEETNIFHFFISNLIINLVGEQWWKDSLVKSVEQTNEENFFTGEAMRALQAGGGGVSP